MELTGGAAFSGWPARSKMENPSLISVRALPIPGQTRGGEANSEKMLKDTAAGVCPTSVANMLKSFTVSRPGRGCELQYSRPPHSLSEILLRIVQTSMTFRIRATR
jgi:hypothetical protein